MNANLLLAHQTVQSLTKNRKVITCKKGDLPN